MLFRSVLGNTNSGLVKSVLSQTQLTLTFTPGRWGTATITVGAADADGVCVPATLVVTVRPLLYTSPPVQPAATSLLAIGSAAGQGMSVAPGSGTLSAPG